MDNVSGQIGLIQTFFKSKLEANSGEPLVEDLELPPKQRPMASRTRLPASGKIPPLSGVSGPTSSPQKRPAPPAAARAAKPGLGVEPSKKKAKKNSGVALEMPNFNVDGDVDQATGTDGPKDSTPVDLNTNPVDGSGMLDGASDAQVPPQDHTHVPMTNGTTA